MMREILFRGKPKNLKKYEWVHGHLLHHSEKLSKIYADEIDYPIGVIPETVGQFTGLTDKNGKKIFEGDIIKYSIEEDQAVFIGAVKFGEFNPDGGALYNTNVGFYVELVDQEGKRTYMRKDIGFWVKFRKIEVIGNIHDQPELLEGGA
jgi:uncharacterized phage protein (TIGR01671 family)